MNISSVTYCAPLIPIECVGSYVCSCRPSYLYLCNSGSKYLVASGLSVKDKVFTCKATGFSMTTEVSYFKKYSDWLNWIGPSNVRNFSGTYKCVRGTRCIGSASSSYGSYCLCLYHKIYLDHGITLSCSTETSCDSWKNSESCDTVSMSYKISRCTNSYGIYTSFCCSGSYYNYSKTLSGWSCNPVDTLYTWMPS